MCLLCSTVNKDEPVTAFSFIDTLQNIRSFLALGLCNHLNDTQGSSPEPVRGPVLIPGTLVLLRRFEAYGAVSTQLFCFFLHVVCGANSELTLLQD